MSQKRSRREFEADLRKQEAPFVIYGTPLPPLDDNVRDDGSYVPLWKQEVTDDRGRKRLHGAFTGGFSAGYFNSVGSKEGWTPSTFVSSRSNRAKDSKNIVQQKVEDFMDEEDMRELEESRQVSLTDGFGGFGTSEDAGVRNALDDILRPAEDTMGEKLLNRMGWKKGQGIGPRILRRINPSDENSEMREFPPDDTPMLSLSQQTDTKGIGFASEAGALVQPATNHKSKIQNQADSEDDDEGRPGLSFMKRSSTKAKKPVRSGIGVGSLNDTGSDDEDPYEIGPKVSYSRVVGGEKAQKRSKTSATSNANPLLKQKPVFISKSKQLPSALASLRKCHDGKLPLTGFVLADTIDSLTSMSLSDSKYAPPEVPEDWQPIKAAAIVPENGSRPHATTPQPQAQTAESRRRALGEASLPSKSIFDFLSPAARDRLATATGNTNLPPALNEAPPSSSNATVNININTNALTIPYLDPEIAKTALHRLRKDPPASTPYSTDLAKQTRYKDFLRYSADPLPVAQRILPLRAPEHRPKFQSQPQHAPSPSQTPTNINNNDSSSASASASDREHLAELTEFAATASLFRPATGFLASRFTTASTSTTIASTDQAGNENHADAEEGEEEREKTLLTHPKPSKPSDPAEEAARMGMFGPAMTRSVRGWMPTRLVCRRFGVEMPIDFNE